MVEKPDRPESVLADAAPEDVCGLLNTHESGLTPEESIKAKELYGENKIAEAKGKPVILIFLGNFTSLMSLLLWAGGAVALFFTDTPQLGIAIWMVNLINGVFSFVQEFRAGKATDALKKMLASYSRVIRNGKEQQILAEELLPGDIMLIEEGDKISADARLIAATDLQVNQSALTGESNPIRKRFEAISSKNLSAFEYMNMVYAGTTVSSGSGKAVVSAIGMKTEFGKIAGLTQSMKEVKSPLQKELDKLTRQISVIAVTIGIFFFLAAVFFLYRIR